MGSKLRMFPCSWDSMTGNIHCFPGWHWEEDSPVSAVMEDLSAIFKKLLVELVLSSLKS